MLENFRILGFKCFRDFHIGGMRRINLLAGKNGCGKSALLEAISLFHRPDPERLVGMLEARDELDPASAVWKLESVLPLFWRPAGATTTDGVPAIELKGERSLRIRIGWYRKLNGVWTEVPPDETLAPLDLSVRPGLVFERSSPRATSLDLVELDGSRPMSTRLPARSLTDPQGLPDRSIWFVFPGEHSPVHLGCDAPTSRRLSELFERIVATESEARLNEMIRWIVPDAERLVTKGSGEGRAIFVKRRQAQYPEPLKRFGDGLGRITGIALAVANSRGGCCLIDEIENGIHYELLGRLWETLSHMSTAFDVQVFATTHSKDCIEAFERSFQSPNFDACFYRLERSGDAIKPVRLDHEHFFSVVAGREYEIR